MSSLIEDLPGTSNEPRPLFTDVYREDENFNGLEIKLKFEIVIDQCRTALINYAMAGDEVTTEQACWPLRVPIRRYSLFLDHLSSGSQCRQISVTDIALTVVVNTGWTVPSEMREEVLADLFAEESDIEKFVACFPPNPISQTDSFPSVGISLRFLRNVYSAPHKASSANCF